jgi:hypothetical protein
VSEQPFIPFAARGSDDAFVRVAAQARERTRRKGGDELEQHCAELRAIAHLASMQPHERNHETAVTAAAGPYRRTA